MGGVERIVETMGAENLPPEEEIVPAKTGGPEGRPTLINRIVAVDHAFLRTLASLTLPKPLVLPLILLVRVGDGWIWFLVAFGLWKFLPLIRLEASVLHSLLTVAISLAIYWPVKLLVRRPRPHDCGLGITPSVPPLDKFSFPSGHTMNNLAVALTVSLYLPRLLIPAILLPISMGILRILFGVHYLSDITGGALLGTLGFFLAKVIFPHLHLHL